MLLPNKPEAADKEVVEFGSELLSLLQSFKDGRHDEVSQAQFKSFKRAAREILNVGARIYKPANFSYLLYCFVLAFGEKK